MIHAQGTVGMTEMDADSRYGQPSPAESGALNGGGATAGATTPDGRQPFMSRLMNLVLAAVLALPALVIVGLIYLCRLVYERRPPAAFLYSGTRLGMHRKPYTMYKIRTLKQDSEFERQGIILPPGSGRELKFGVLLRESRLDELPQLWNVIRGDMNLVGPRPLRPVVYESLKTSIPDCDLIFRVKPGMTGYSQFLTPSHTPKRIRIAIDSHFVLRGSRPLGELFLIGWTIAMVAKHTVNAVARRLAGFWIMRRKRGKGAEKRVLRRYKPRYAWMQMSDAQFTERDTPLVPVHDINYQAFSFISDRAPDVNAPLHFFLVGHKHCETGPVKRARCRGYVRKHYPVSGAPSETARRYVVFYEPVSELHRYMADHYVLRETVA